MQFMAIMALVGLVNIVGVAVTSEADMARRGVDSNEYQATVEVEDVSSRSETKPHGSLLEALSN